MVQLFSGSEHKECKTLTLVYQLKPHKKEDPKFLFEYRQTKKNKYIETEEQ